MEKTIVYYLTLSIVLLLHVGFASVLERFLDDASPCENFCSETYNAVKLSASCSKGCRLLKIIGLAKDLSNKTKVEELCIMACNEAYKPGKEQGACSAGCKKEATLPESPEVNIQTLHVLTPSMYIKQTYDKVAHHIRQLVTASWTFYVQEDSGKNFVVVQTNPKTFVEVSEYDFDTKTSGNVERSKSTRGSSDWMDCISQQSGLPRWILMSVLFGFVIALMWLCCVTTVTAPNHHVNTNSKKISPKNDVGYLLLYEPMDNVKVPYPEMEAPPLPPKAPFA